MAERTLGAKPLTVLALACVLAWACNEPAASEDVMCPEAAVPLCAKLDSTVAVVSPMTNDAVIRSAAALQNSPLRTALAAEIGAIRAAIAGGNVTQMKQGISRARTAIAAARQQNGHPGDAPDLSAIELALIQLELATK